MNRERKEMWFYLTRNVVIQYLQNALLLQRCTLILSKNLYLLSNCHPLVGNLVIINISTIYNKFSNKIKH